MQSKAEEQGQLVTAPKYFGDSKSNWRAFAECQGRHVHADQVRAA